MVGWPAVFAGLADLRACRLSGCFLFKYAAKNMLFLTAFPLLSLACLQLMAMMTPSALTNLTIQLPAYLDVSAVRHMPGGTNLVLLQIAMPTCRSPRSGAANLLVDGHGEGTAKPLYAACSCNSHVQARQTLRNSHAIATANSAPHGQHKDCSTPPGIHLKIVRDATDTTTP